VWKTKRKEKCYYFSFELEKKSERVYSIIRNNRIYVYKYNIIFRYIIEIIMFLNIILY